MSGDDKEQTEETPQGLTVAVPSREEFFGNLRKASKPDKPEAPASSDSQRGRAES